MGMWRTSKVGVLAMALTMALAAGAGKAALMPLSHDVEAGAAPVVAVAAAGMVHLPQARQEARLLPQVEETRRATAAGQEGVWLAARLMRNGGLVHRPVSWEISGDGKLRRLLLPQARVALKPGHYEVRVRYGLRHVRHAFEVRAGEETQLVFILNVGGLRALARLEGMREPLQGVEVEHRILRPLADGRRELLAASGRQGEILRLPAGHYELESRFRPGNAKVITPVRIKPGRLHGYEIAARAGLLHLQATGTWTIRALDGSWAASGIGKRTLVLAPGSYEISTTERRQRINIAVGKILRWPNAH